MRQPKNVSNGHTWLSERSKILDVDDIEEVTESVQLEIIQIQLNYVNHDQSEIFGVSMVLQPMQDMIFIICWITSLNKEMQI